MEVSVGKRISDLLAEQNISQREFAKELNLTEAAISRYINGSRIPMGAILLNIAKKLGTTTDYLLGKSEKVHSDDFSKEKEDLFKIIARNAKSFSAEDKERFLKILFAQE